MRELSDLGLVAVRRVPVNPDDFDLERIRNTYTLDLARLGPARQPQAAAGTSGQPG